MNEPIPDAVRRFVLTSIPTVPHLETLLLLWREPQDAWSADRIAARLYVSTTSAAALASELRNAGLLEGDSSLGYRLRSGVPELAALIEAVDTVYRKQLRAITALIHSGYDNKAARFAQAFSFRKKD